MVTIKDMRLVFDIFDGMWKRTVTDMQGNIIWEYEKPIENSQTTPEMIDAWEAQMKQLPIWNIIEVERNWH